MTQPTSLAAWLALLEQRHAKPIDMSLERVVEVRRRMGLNPSFPIITVGGTNGKGSTCAMLEAMLLAAGYRVGCHTSPHLVRFNERARINGAMAEDAQLVGVFKKVEEAVQAAPAVSLTYFEFTLLGIVRLFEEARVDVAVLEIGMGGRLDAVNIFDAACSVVTSVDLDHMQFLGDTREKIGWEKAHIYRAGKPAICADPAPPQSLIDYATTLGANLYVAGRDFGYEVNDEQRRTQWNFWSREAPGSANLVRRSSLSYPALRGVNQLLNASGVLAALTALREVLPVSMQAIRRGLAEVELAGRFQVLPGQPTVILDVAHNPQAAGVLAENLGMSGYAPETIAVFGAMHDKDLAGVIARVRKQVTRWHVCSLPGPRGAQADDVRKLLAEAGIQEPVEAFTSPEAAFDAAKVRAQPGVGEAQGDRIVVFGSFVTVASVMQHLGRVPQ
jgi:dihydrofolate synthase / folylpolyglutamate synthase